MIFPPTHLPNLTWIPNVLWALRALCHPPPHKPGKWLASTFPPLFFWSCRRTTKHWVKPTCPMPPPSHPTDEEAAGRAQYPGGSSREPQPGSSSNQLLLHGGLRQRLVASSWDNRTSEGGTALPGGGKDGSWNTAAALGLRVFTSGRHSGDA